MNRMNRIPKNRTMAAWSEPYPVNPVHPVQSVFFGRGFAALGLLRFFAATQLKCLTMNHLHTKPSGPGQAQSSLVKAGQGIFSALTMNCHPNQGFWSAAACRRFCQAEASFRTAKSRGSHAFALAFMPGAVQLCIAPETELDTQFLCVVFIIKTGRPSAVASRAAKAFARNARLTSAKVWPVAAVARRPLRRSSNSWIKTSGTWMLWNA